MLIFIIGTKTLLLQMMIMHASNAELLWYAMLEQAL